MCEFQSECGGTGTLYCAGCGGDLCVCRCGGERDCDGCWACDPDDFDGDDYPEDDCDDEG